MARPGSPRYFANLAIFAAVVGATGLLLFTVGLAYRSAYVYTHPSREPARITPARLGLAYEDVVLQTEDGLRLAAWYVPSRNRAAIILVHGFAANRGDLLLLGRDLALCGYGLLLLDLRAHGESEGQISTLGVYEVRDVRAGLGYLLERSEVDHERIGIYGGSLGAATAIMAAAELPQLRAVAAESAFASLDWVIQHQFDSFVTLPSWLAPMVIAFGTWQTGVEPELVAPSRSIGRISPRPVLLIHGDRDEVVRVANTLVLAESAGPPTEVWILPGVGHVGAYRADPQRFLKRVAGFFDRALRPVAIPAGRPQAMADAARCGTIAPL